MFRILGPLCALLLLFTLVVALFTFLFVLATTLLHVWCCSFSLVVHLHLLKLLFMCYYSFLCLLLFLCMLDIVPFCELLPLFTLLLLFALSFLFVLVVVPFHIFFFGCLLLLLFCTLYKRIKGLFYANSNCIGCIYSKNPKNFKHPTTQDVLSSSRLVKCKLFSSSNVIRYHEKPMIILDKDFSTGGEHSYFDVCFPTQNSFMEGAYLELIYFNSLFRNLEHFKCASYI